MTGQLAGPEPAGLLVLAALVLGGSWAGRRRRRRRRALVAWLTGGVEVFGGAAASRWAGTRLLQVRVEQAAFPFHTLSLSVRVGWGGFLGSLAGRGDRLVVEASLAQAPQVDFDLFYPEDGGARGVSGRAAAHAAAAAGWRVSRVGERRRARAGFLHLAEPPGGGVAPREALLRTAAGVEELWPGLRRVAVRRRPPHLLAVALPPPGADGTTAQALFDLLREAAETGIGPARRARGPGSGRAPQPGPRASPPARVP